MMRKHKTRWYQRYLRLVIAWRLVTGKSKHIIVLSMDEQAFTATVAQSLFTEWHSLKDIDLTYIGMCEIQAYYAMLFAVGTYDPTLIPLMRAEFQADVDESMLNAQSDADVKRSI